MKSISTKAFKHTLGDIQNHSENRKFCFVLGAGASRKSGIPTGRELAEKWFSEIQNMLEDNEFNKWGSAQKINKKDLATSYGDIYRKRFEIDKTLGYEFLVNEMKDAKPSFGHFIISQILSRYGGHCVVTTNFDSLVESSVYQFTNKTPLVCGHESLSGYARPSETHPLIIKIHRDLLLAPQSDPDDISKLDEGWKESLDNIFSTHIPIVIGYGGNDGSLMHYFEEMNKPSNFFWCGLDEISTSEPIKKLIEKHDGNFVTIDGFDELMHELMQVFDKIKPIKEELTEKTNEIITTFEKQLEEIKNPKIINHKSNQRVTSNKKERKELSALEYGRLAEKEPDLEKRKHIYLEALKKYPKTGWLWWDFTYFLVEIKMDYENLDQYFQIGLLYNKNEEAFITNYANFLRDIKKEYNKAEEYYLKALSINSNDAIINHNYAVFLKNTKKDYEKAEEYYLKALALDPNDSGIIGDYATFLSTIKGDYIEADKFYLRALSNNPNDSVTIGNYANFQFSLKKDYVKAEELYLKALNIEPNHFGVNGNYATFLYEIKKEFDKAEEYYLKATSNKISNETQISNYASFLYKVREDSLKAEELYLQALAINPNDVHIIGNYAYFLKKIKKDQKMATEYYLQALTIDPNHADHNGNYAQLLLENGKLTDAETFIKKAFENQNNEDDLIIELWFYRYAHYKEYMQEAECKIEELLEKGLRSIGWDFEGNIKQAIKDGHPNPDKLKDFAKRITSE